MVLDLILQQMDSLGDVLRGHSLTREGFNPYAPSNRLSACYHSSKKRAYERRILEVDSMNMPSFTPLIREATVAYKHIAAALLSAKWGGGGGGRHSYSSTTA